METSQSLAIESFSYSWLSDNKPSLGGLDESPRESIGDYYENFNFDAISQTHEPVVIHADELFTNGFIRPIYIDPSKRDSCNTTLDSIQTPISSSSSRNEIPKGRIHCSSLRKYGKSTKRMLKSLFEHLRPWCHKLGCLRKSTRVNDIERRIMWNSSPQVSPKQIKACTSMGGDSCHLENSIYEAVLHCKRSIEK